MISKSNYIGRILISLKDLGVGIPKEQKNNQCCKGGVGSTPWKQCHNQHSNTKWNIERRRWKNKRWRNIEKTIEYHQCLQKHSTHKKQTQSQCLVKKLINETQTKSQRDKITYKITKHNERRNKSRKITPYAHVDIWIDKITIFVLT